MASREERMGPREKQQLTEVRQRQPKVIPPRANATRRRELEKEPQDFIIECGDMVYDVHTPIFRLWSGWFASRPGKFEPVISKDGDAINLYFPVVEEQGLTAFAECMYSFNYKYPLPEDGTTLELHRAVYAFGVKNGCPELREKALEHFKNACARLWHTRSSINVIRAIYDLESGLTKNYAGLLQIPQYNIPTT